MLAFYLNNKPFALDASKSVRLSWKNPACYIDDFPGDIGMGIEIPVNDINRALLGNPERFERYAEKNTREYSRFEIRFSGVLLMGGTLIIHSAGNETYSGLLRSDVGNLGKEQREKFIFESISFNEPKSFINKADYDPLTDDYGCPRIFNPDFFKEKGEKTFVSKWVINPNYVPFSPKRKNSQYILEEIEVEDLTESFMRTAAWQVNAQNEDGTVKTPVSETSGLLRATAQKVIEELKVCAVSPMLFLNFVLKTILKDADFYLDRNFIADDPDLRKLLLYNNFDITTMDYTRDQYIIRLDGHIGEEHQAIVWTTIHIKRHYNGPFLYKDLVPQIHLKDFLLSIQNLLNVVFHFRPGRKIVDVIDRESILTGSAIDIEKYLTGFWKMEEKKDITLKFSFEHDKADTIFAEYWENIDDYRDKEKEPVESWEDIERIEEPDIGEIRYIKNINKYVRYQLYLKKVLDPVTKEEVQEKMIGWGMVSMGFQNAYINYGKHEVEKVSAKFSTLENAANPTTYQMGNIQSQMFDYVSFSPRLLFYMGNNKGSYETPNISLDWEKGDTGLIITRWKNWARFWSTRQAVECEALFPLAMLNFVILNIYRRFRTREGEFIIEEMETEFRLNEIGKTKIKGYKMNHSPEIISLRDMWKLDDPIWIDQPIDFSRDLIFFSAKQIVHP